LDIVKDPHVQALARKLSFCLKNAQPKVLSKHVKHLDEFLVFDEDDLPGYFNDSSA